MDSIDYEFRQLARDGKCCACGRRIHANRDYAIHGYNYKSNAGTIALCTFCVINMNRLIEDSHYES